jgi:hypothetical protein
LDEKKYQRSASAPKRSSTENGSTTLPLDFDIFWPSSSRIRPRQTTLRYGDSSNSSTEIASSE